jgi:hypothetical protein
VGIFEGIFRHKRDELSGERRELHVEVNNVQAYYSHRIVSMIKYRSME